MQPRRGSGDAPSEFDEVSASARIQKGTVSRERRSRVPSLDSSNGSLHDDAVSQDNGDQQASSASQISATDSFVTESVFSKAFTLEDMGLPTPLYDQTSSENASPRQVIKGHDTAPVDVSPFSLSAGSLSPPSPSYSGPMPGPLLSPRSPVNPDTQRLSTAPAAAAEDTFQSLLMGEPGPEVRLSVDIPSLTSSTSTMTRESNWTHRVQARQALPNGQPRPASFSVTPFGRRRSSLASLGRFINSSHSERSKLSVEVTMDGSDQGTKPKLSKTKRFSRMMQFWKPKDNAMA
jgi:hypothetical protein